jgi:chromosome partitioning protein
VPRSTKDKEHAVPVIAFFNQKGGTAKTTSTLNVGAALAERGHKTLAIDLDPQASLTMALGVDVLTLEQSSYDLLVDDDIEIGDVVMPTTIANLAVVPSHPDLAAAELQLLNALERERALARKLTPKALAALDIEYLLIDSPPSLNVVSINILVAADYLVIPIEPHPLSVMVLPKLFEMVGRVQRLNPKLQIIGFLPTKVHGTSRLAADMLDDLRTGFPDLAILPSIPLSVRGAEAVAAYTSILAYSPRSPIAEAYRQVAQEVEREVGP